jgi:hypothetical protein
VNIEAKPLCDNGGKGCSLSTASRWWYRAPERSGPRRNCRDFCSGEPKRMSALPLKADIGVTLRHVSFVPPEAVIRKTWVGQASGGDSPDACVAS